MAIGERIKFMRNLRGMTQKYLGMAVGFDAKTADIRMAQYESGTRHPAPGTRTPKAELTRSLANALDVSPYALEVPDIDSNIGLMHTLFTLEDLRGLKIDMIDGILCLRLDKSNGKAYDEMGRMLSPWYDQAAKLKAGEITKEEYDQWRYRYPEFDRMQRRAKVPSQGLSDLFTKKLKKEK